MTLLGLEIRGRLHRVAVGILQMLPISIAKFFVNRMHVSLYRQLNETAEYVCKRFPGGLQPADALFVVGRQYRMRDGGWVKVLSADGDRIAGSAIGGPYFPKSGYWMWYCDGRFTERGQRHSTDLLSGE